MQTLNKILCIIAVHLCQVLLLFIFAALIIAVFGALAIGFFALAIWLGNHHYIPIGIFSGALGFLSVLVGIIALEKLFEGK